MTLDRRTGRLVGSRVERGSGCGECLDERRVRPASAVLVPEIACPPERGDNEDRHELAGLARERPRGAERRQIAREPDRGRVLERAQKAEGAMRGGDSPESVQKARHRGTATPRISTRRSRDRPLSSLFGATGSLSGGPSTAIRPRSAKAGASPARTVSARARESSLYEARRAVRISRSSP